MSDFIHILLLNIELGPYSERHVRNSLAAGHLELTDLARYEPNKEWKPLGEVLATLPQRIVVTPPLLNLPPLPVSVAPATVLIEPAPPRLIEAPAIAFYTPEPLQPAIVLVKPSPPKLTEAPVVAEFVVGTLQPATTLFSPLQPANQQLPKTKEVLAVAKSTPEPSAQEIVSQPPASQRLPEKTETPDETSASVRLKEREITPPPKPVVPYNQPIPRPGPTPLDQWNNWGKYVAILAVFLILIISMSWQWVGPVLGYYWADLNLSFFQLLDNLIALFTVRPAH